MKSKIIIRIIFLQLTICTLVTIFIFSSQDGTKSKSTSTTVMREIVDINPKTKKLNESEKDIIVEKSQPFIRKTAHFTMYMVLGINLIGFYSTFDLKSRKRILLTVLCGLIYAISDEIHQGITGGGRTPKIFDVCIDTIGTYIGTFIMLGFVKLVKNNKNFYKTQ